jgi:hypothetical protein
VAALTAKRCHRAGSEPHFSCSRLALWRSSARRRREAPSSDMQNLHCSRRLAHISSAVPRWTRHDERRSLWCRRPIAISRVALLCVHNV